MQGTMKAIAQGGASPVAKQEIKKPTTGHEAQGFAVAMRVLGISRTAARELHRCVVSLFELDPAARDAAAKFLTTRKEAVLELQAQGRLDEKEAKKMLSSSNVYASELRQVIKAMNDGMTQDTILAWCHDGALRLTGTSGLNWAPDAFSNVGYRVIVKVARDYLAAKKGTASKRGRPATPFAAKMAAWLNKNSPDEEDAEALALYNKLVSLVNEVNSGDKMDAPM